MSSKNILQQALQQYEGTCMIVSHDRAFLDPIVNKVLEIRPGNIKIYLGNVSYYLDKKKEEESRPEGSNRPCPRHVRAVAACARVCVL